MVRARGEQTNRAISLHLVVSPLTPESNKAGRRDRHSMSTKDWQHVLVTALVHHPRENHDDETLLLCTHRAITHKEHDSNAHMLLNTPS